MDDNLIIAVCRREPLWDPTHKLHRNVNVLKSLWDEVAEETCRDVKTVKTRWKNLRAYYVKECQKSQRGKGIKKDPYTSPWQYFEPLKFLGTNFDKVLLPDDNTDDSSSTIHNIEETYDAFQERGFPLIEIEPDQHYISPSPPRKKFRSDESITDSKDEVFRELEVKKIESLEQDTAKRANDDLLFFESLLPYMKNIPLVRKLRLRSRIQDLISKELEVVQNGNEDVK